VGSSRSCRHGRHPDTKTPRQVRRLTSSLGRPPIADRGSANDTPRRTYRRQDRAVAASSSARYSAIPSAPSSDSMTHDDRKPRSVAHNLSRSPTSADRHERMLRRRGKRVRLCGMIFAGTQRVHTRSENDQLSPALTNEYGSAKLGDPTRSIICKFGLRRTLKAVAAVRIRSGLHP
jgi:hypothetical protein